MVRTITRSAAAIAALLVMAAAVACAPKRIELPDPSIAPKFPDFVFPVVPEGLGTPPVRRLAVAGHGHEPHAMRAVLGAQPPRHLVAVHFG